MAPSERERSSQARWPDHGNDGFNLRRQAEAAGVPYFFKQWGGRRDKGGCLLQGIEIKQWPQVA